LGDILKTNCAQIIWAIFFRKNAPNAKKYPPNGEISPNLVTMTKTKTLKFEGQFSNFNRGKFL
jgi:hypothetical protein